MTTRIRTRVGSVINVLFTFVFLSVISSMASIAYAKPSIVSGSSTGGHTQQKRNPQDLIYKVQPGDVITFTASANNSCTFTWKVMLGAKVLKTYKEDNAKRSSFKWQVPNKVSTWDVEVEIFNYKPSMGPYEQDHKIWTITTSKIVVVEPGKDIQKAIDSLPKEGGVVELKEGVWKLNNSRTPILINRSGITLRGQGKNKTTISLTEHVHHGVIRISEFKDDKKFLCSASDRGVRGELTSCGGLEPRVDKLCKISNIVIEDIHLHGFDRKFNSYFDNVAIEGAFFKNTKFSDLWIDNIGNGPRLWKSVNGIVQYCIMEHIGVFWDFGPFCGYTIRHNTFHHGGNGYVIKFNGACNHNKFVNNIIHHVDGWALQLYGVSSENTVKNNLIMHVGRGYGMWIWGFRNLIKGNVIHDCKSDGICLYNSWAFSDPSKNVNTISNNLIYNNARSGISTYSGRTMNTTTRTANITNNVIYGNGKDGITCDGILRDTKPPANGKPVYRYNIENNIIANNKKYGINYIGGRGINLSYNDVYNNSLGNYNGTSSGKGHISSNPLFADPENEDFHLKSQAGRWNGTTWIKDNVTSPCIDAGDPKDDFSNEPKPNAGRINIGAYGNTKEASKS